MRLYFRLQGTHGTVDDILKSNIHIADNYYEQVIKLYCYRASYIIITVIVKHCHCITIHYCNFECEYNFYII